jgi:hypothetical protein
MKVTDRWQMSWQTKEVGVEVTIECRWTKSDIEEMLLEKMHAEGLKIIPQQKKRKEDPDQLFVWPRSNKVKVRARAVIDPSARAADEDDDVDDDTPPPKKKKEPLDTSLLPDGANVDAILAVERAAEGEEEDPLESAARQRPLGPGESRSRDD